MAFIRYLLEDRGVLDNPRQAAIERICSDPGLPNSHSSTDSFWITHAKSRVSEVGSQQLPDVTDVLVIGSGVSGVSVAHHLLNAFAESANGDRKPQFSVTMLDARGFCSGATGRNGGHIYPYADDYSELKATVGEAEAKKIVKFRFEHVNTLVTLAQDLGVLEETQARRLESVNVYLDREEFDAAVGRLIEFQADMPEVASGYKVYKSGEARTKFGVPHAAGVICHPAGAVWPYKLMTALVRRLQELYPDRFHLATNAPAEQILTSNNADDQYPFQVTTPRGIVHAKHVVHCTEGHQAHLLPSFRGVIFPLRGQMSAQRPCNNFPHQGSDRSWIIYYEEGYDYLTQLPISGPASDGEMMLGGGLLPTTRHCLNEIGVATDDCLNVRISAHLKGALEVIFGEEDQDIPLEHTVKAMWTGIMGFSSDGFPWVGKLPPSLTNRQFELQDSKNAGEWVTSGFSGEGMVLAWLCGKALAQMVHSELREKSNSISANGDDASSWFPDTFRVSPQRVDKARFRAA